MASFNESFILGCRDDLPGLGFDVSISNMMNTRPGLLMCKALSIFICYHAPCLPPACTCHALKEKETEKARDRDTGREKEYLLLSTVVLGCIGVHQTTTSTHSLLAPDHTSHLQDRHGMVDSGMNQSIDELLEHRHETMLQWCEPRPACGPDGNDVDAHIIHQATIHDCINLSRAVARKAGRETMGNDREHLLDFIAVHWAEVVVPDARTQSHSLPP